MRRSLVCCGSGKSAVNWVDHAFPPPLDDVVETRFDGNLRADIAKKCMAQ